MEKSGPSKEGFNVQVGGGGLAYTRIWKTARSWYGNADSIEKAPTMELLKQIYLYTSAT